MKKLFVILVLLTAMDANAQWVQYGKLSNTSISLDTIALKYFPLAVGNVYNYHFSSSAFVNYYYKVRVLKDTIISTKRYFIVNRSFPGYPGGIIRCDSASGNIYSRSNSGYCSYSPFEELLDSLSSRLGDSAIVCRYLNSKHICIDTSNVTIFGNQFKSKIFSFYRPEENVSVIYAMNLGIVQTYYMESGGVAAEFLVGGYINGVLYGDTITGVNQTSSKIPSTFSLSQNYPNPFNPTTKIKFSIVNVGDVKLVVYDIQGREVQTLVNESLKPGTYEAAFDGSALNSGVYFYKLITNGFTETKKMLLIK